MYVKLMSKHFLGRGRHKTVNQSVQSSGALIIIDLKNNYLLKNLLTGWILKQNCIPSFFISSTEFKLKLHKWQRTWLRIDCLYLHTVRIVPLSFAVDNPVERRQELKTDRHPLTVREAVYLNILQVHMMLMFLLIGSTLACLNAPSKLPRAPGRYHNAIVSTGAAGDQPMFLKVAGLVYWI